MVIYCTDMSHAEPPDDVRRSVISRLLFTRSNVYVVSSKALTAIAESRQRKPSADALEP